MKASDFYGSDYLKASDLQRGKKVRVTIGKIDRVHFEGDAKPKPLLFFREKEHKPMVLNPTNTREIVNSLGDDMDDWLGKPIYLYSTKVDFGGKLVGAIRVDAGGVEDLDDDVPL